MNKPMVFRALGPRDPSSFAKHRRSRASGPTLEALNDQTNQTRRRYILGCVSVGLTLVKLPVAHAADDQILQLFPSGGQGCTDTVAQPPEMRSGQALGGSLREDALKDRIPSRPLDVWTICSTSISTSRSKCQTCDLPSGGRSGAGAGLFLANDKTSLPLNNKPPAIYPSFNFLPIRGLTGNSTTLSAAWIWKIPAAVRWGRGRCRGSLVQTISCGFVGLSMEGGNGS
jgi:hypothetical protein